MTEIKKIRIGTRGSKLAMIQTELCLAALMEKWPDIRFEVVAVNTVGDIDRNIRLLDSGETGIFVKEIEERLLECDFDVAVHSLKDMPLKSIKGLRIGAVIERGDPRDVLVSRSGKLSELKTGSVIGTGSPRRKLLITNSRSDIIVIPIRGNLNTRIEKVFSGEVEAVVVSAAGVKRLGVENSITEFFSTSSFVPETGQGIIALQTREDDSEIERLVKSVNHEPTWHCSIAERQLLGLIGGGCHSPDTAFARIDGNHIELWGMKCEIETGEIKIATAKGNIESMDQIVKNVYESINSKKNRWDLPR